MFNDTTKKYTIGNNDDLSLFKSNFNAGSGIAESSAEAATQQPIGQKKFTIGDNTSDLEKFKSKLAEPKIKSQYSDAAESQKLKAASSISASKAQPVKTKPIKEQPQIPYTDQRWQSFKVPEVKSVQQPVQQSQAKLPPNLRKVYEDELRQDADGMSEIADIVAGTRNPMRAKPTTPGVGEVIGKSILTGMAHADMSALNIPRMVHKGISNVWDAITPDFLYKKENDPLTKVLDKGVEHFEKQAEKTKESLGELKGFKNFLNTGLESLPTMVMAAVGGAGIGGGAAANTLGQSAKLAPEIARMIPFGTIAAGGYARDAEHDGASYTQQVLYGALSGMAEMATETPVVEGVLGTISQLGAGKLIEQGSKNFISKYGKIGLAWLSNTLKEGLQEAVIEPITGTIKKMTYDKNMPIYGDGGIVDPKQMGSAFYGGVAMSVILGALGLPAYAASRKYVENRIETGKPLDSKAIEKTKSLMSQEIDDYYSMIEYLDEINRADPNYIQAEAKQLMNQDIKKVETAKGNIGEKMTDLNAPTAIETNAPIQTVTDEAKIKPESNSEAAEGVDAKQAETEPKDGENSRKLTFEEYKALVKPDFVEDEAAWEKKVLAEYNEIVKKDQAGKNVTLKTFGKVEIVDDTDKSMVKVKNKNGTIIPIGRKHFENLLIGQETKGETVSSADMNKYADDMQKDTDKIDNAEIGLNVYIENSANNVKQPSYVPISKVTEEAALKIYESTGYDVKGYTHKLSDNDIRHILKVHGDEKIEAARGQIPVSIDDIKKIPQIIENPDNIRQGSANKENRSIIYEKRINGHISYVEVILEGHKSLQTKTMWKKPSAQVHADTLVSPSPYVRNESSLISSTDDIIPQQFEFMNNENEEVPTGKHDELNRSGQPVVAGTPSDNNISQSIENDSIKDVEKGLRIQIDSWQKGEMKPNEVFNFGETPEVLIDLGAGKKPLVMTQNAVAKIVSKHELSIENVVDLPKNIADPIMIFQSKTVPNSFVVLTEIVDNKGRSVIAAIHLDKIENRIEVNRIASAYGRNNEIKFVRDNIEEGNLLYSNSKKSDLWFTSRGLQLPKLVQTNHHSNNSILKSDENINKTKNKKEVALGKEATAVTGDGEEMGVRYAVVDADRLIASHDTALNPNSAYPSELQPRQRERQSSVLQINKIMNSLNPALLGENPLVSDGAPIIGDDLVVESGNGRTIALKKMYETENENKQKYIDWLEENKLNFGITEELPSNPILVRIRETDIDRPLFVKKANESSVAAMSYSEQAKSDAEKLTDSTVLKFVQNDEGTINTVANKEFITAFVRDSVPQSEMPRVMTKEGMLSQEGLIRIKNALFYKAYEDISLIDIFSESLDNTIKNITNFMLNMAPKIIYIKSQIKAGNLYNLDFSNDIAEAARVFKALKDKGQNVEEYLDQFSFFGDVDAEVAEILNILDKNNRSAKKLTTVFNYILDGVINAGNPNQVSMFENEVPTKEDILDYAVRRFKNEQSGEAGGQLTLFEIESQNSTKVDGDSDAGRKAESGKGTKSKGVQSSAIVEPLTGLNPQLPTSDGSSKLENTKTVDEIVEIIEKAIGVPIRTGKFRQRAHGIFKTVSEVIRVKVTNDLPTICHEVGHYLDKKFSLDDTQFKNELMALGRPASRASYSYEEVRAEGVAEFVRLYLTNTREAQNKAPGFLQHFEAKLDKDSLTMLNSIRTDILKVVNLSAGDRILNDMSIGEARKATKQGTSLSSRMQKAYNAWINEYAPFARVQKRAEESGYQGKNIDITVQTYRGLEGKVLGNINMAQTDLSGKVIGKSFNEMLKPIKKNEVNDFRKYMVARRAIDYENRAMVMPEPYAVYHDTVISMEQKHSHFEDVFSDLRHWEDNELQLLVDSGIMSKQAVETIKENNPNHVPLYRIQEAVEAVHGGSGSTLGQSKKVVKKAKGSGKTIIDPIESMIFNAFIIRRAAEANQINSMLADMADSIEGFGDLVEAVPPGMKGFTFNVEEIEKKLKDMWETDTGQELDTTGVDLDKLVTLFRANYRERNNEITVYRNGKPKLYQLETELYKAIKGLNREASHFIIRALNVPKRILQSGAVTTVQFVMRNIARDTSASLIQSEAGINLADIFKSYWSAFRKDKWYQQWVQSGGATEYLQVNQRTQVQGILDDVIGYTLIDKLQDAIKKPTKENLTRLLFTPINTIRDAMEWSEAGPRVAEMRKAIEKGYSADEAAALSRDLSQDFARAGYRGKELNKITAFFNANVQGIEKQARVFKEHPYRTLFRGLMYVTLPTMFLYFINDDNEKYKQMAAWRKALFYNIPLGNPKTAQRFLSIPKPYGWGFFFGALPETILDGIKNDDPKMWKDIREGFVINFDVPLMPSAFSPLWEIKGNKSWNKTPIESAGDKNKPAYLRYNGKSSMAGKGIANVLKDVPGANKLSPKQIDYVVKGYTGSVGDFFWRLPDTIKKGIELPTDYANYPVVRAFITDTAYSNRTIDDFYTYGEELNMRLAEAKETGTYRAISHLPEDKQKGLVPAIKNATKEYNSVARSFSDGRKAISEIKAEKKYGPAEKKMRERQVQLKMIDIADKFNKKYERFKKQNNIK